MWNFFLNKIFCIFFQNLNFKLPGLKNYAKILQNFHSQVYIHRKDFKILLQNVCVYKMVMKAILMSGALV